MTPEQLDRIPDHLVLERGTNRLREWLWERGWRMSLLELEDERARRRR
jgi:hypothetical protein